MSNPHKFKAELLSSYIPSLFDNKVRSTITHGKDVKIESTLRTKITGSYYGTELSMVTVKCKAFEIFLPLGWKDESVLDKDFDDIPVYFINNITHGNSHPTIGLKELIPQLKLMNDIIAPCVGCSQKKNYTVDMRIISKPRLICQFSSNIMNTNIDMTTNRFVVDYIPRFRELTLQFRTPFYEMDINDFIADPKNKTAEIKTTFKNMRDFDENKMPDIVLKGLEQVKIELNKQFKELYETDKVTPSVSSGLTEVIP